LRRRRSSRGRPHPRSLRCSFLGLFFSLRSRFRLRFGFRNSLNLFADLLRDVGGNRARVRFLFGDTKARQKVNDRLGFDL